MNSSPWILPTPESEPEVFLDSFGLGRRLHALRKKKGLTLAQVAERAEVAPSLLSMIENGKREAKVGVLQRLARLYGTSVDNIISGTPDHRTELEVELEAAMHSPLAQAAGLPPIRISPRTSTEVLEAMVALHRELARQAELRAATPEEARRANTELRREMRARNNHWAEIEAEAAKLLAKVGYTSGPLLERMIREITTHLGFTLAHVSDLPTSTRSVTDLRNRRIYLTRSSRPDHSPRSVLLQALGDHVLGHRRPATYKEFLRQRVETNYFAAALMMPEASVVQMLTAAKADKDIAIEDLRDAFGVSYEIAGHRFTNLATEHLGIQLHFFRVHESGTIHKAYENDGNPFPADHTGAIEGQVACRKWTARQVFEQVDAFNAYHQYTETTAGVYWCTAHTQVTPSGRFSTGVGVPFNSAKWFRGRETRNRHRSTCPAPDCCRVPPSELMDTWAGHAWPATRAHSHLLATLPPGAFPGVDETEVYTFLQAHSETD
ncbi:helix-turn-helix domain-containing protein [Enemella sp. A6]|uniref:helix-turn-helix domain-containing protein n=1 Tax=Enemella sp. A6 TaxID=3440152 RepID=UPI003EB6EC03